MVDTGIGDDDTTEADGTLTMGELEYAIKTNDEVKDLLNTTPSLAPLLLPSTRKSAFKAIDANGDLKLTMNELINLTHVAREHADREYVAHRLNGKPPIICDSMVEMNKVMRYDEKENDKLLAAQEDMKKTKKASGKNQPKVIVPKNKKILTDKQIRDNAIQKDKEDKMKYQKNLEIVKAKSEKKKFFEKTRGSNLLKGEIRSNARSAALNRARNQPSEDEEDDNDDDDDDGQFSDTDYNNTTSTAKSYDDQEEDDDDQEDDQDDQDDDADDAYMNDHDTRGNTTNDYEEEDDQEEDDQEEDDQEEEDEEDSHELDEEEEAMMMESPEKIQPMQPARPTRPTSRSSSGGGGRQRSKSPTETTETTSTEATIKPQRTRCEIQTNDKGECYLCGRPGHKDEFSHPLDDDWETAKKPEEIEIKKWICKNCNTSNPMSYNFCGNCQQPGGDDDDDEDDDDDDDDDDIELDDGEFGEY